MMALTMFFLFKIVLDVCGLLCFHANVRIFFYFCEDIHWTVDDVCIKPIDNICHVAIEDAPHIWMLDAQLVELFGKY